MCVCIKATPVRVQPWTLANMSNVYAKAYKSTHVHLASNNMTNELDCRAACLSTASCLRHATLTRTLIVIATVTLTLSTGLEFL